MRHNRPKLHFFFPQLLGHVSIENKPNGVTEWMTLVLRIQKSRVRNPKPWTNLPSWDLQRRPVRTADNLTTFMCQMSWNLGASAYWKPQGLSRPVMRLLFLILYRKVVKNNNNNNNNNNNVFSLFILSFTSTIPVHPAKSKLKKNKEQRPLLRGWKHLLSVVALKVLTSSTNLFVQFLNLGYCDSASRVLTPLNSLLRNDTLTCRRLMKPEILPIKSEQKIIIVCILMLPFSATIFAILLCLKVKCQIPKFLLVPVLLESDSVNRD